MTETTLVPITVTSEQLDLVKRTVAEGATPEELELYLFDCKRQGVHPLDRLLHFTKRGGRYTPITSIDLMRTRAAETEQCAGIDDAVFPEDDDGLPKWARVTVYRLTDGKPYAYTATARWREYYPGDKQGYMWTKMPHTMLGKCAEALALRKAFPKQLAGLYAKEEMDQAERLDTPPRAPRVAVPVKTDSPPPEPTVESLFPTAEDDERAALLEKATDVAKELNLTGPEKKKYLKDHLGKETADVFSADVAALGSMVRAMEAEVKKRAEAKAKAS